MAYPFSTGPLGHLRTALGPEDPRLGGRRRRRSAVPFRQHGQLSGFGAGLQQMASQSAPALTTTPVSALAAPSMQRTPMQVPTPQPVGDESPSDVHPTLATFNRLQAQGRTPLARLRGYFQDVMDPGTPNRLAQERHLARELTENMRRSGERIIPGGFGAFGGGTTAMNIAGRPRFVTPDRGAEVDMTHPAVVGMQQRNEDLLADLPSNLREQVLGQLDPENTGSFSPLKALLRARRIDPAAVAGVLGTTGRALADLEPGEIATTPVSVGSIPPAGEIPTTTATEGGEGPQTPWGALGMTQPRYRRMLRAQARSGRFNEILGARRAALGGNLRQQMLAQSPMMQAITGMQGGGRRRAAGLRPQDRIELARLGMQGRLGQQNLLLNALLGRERIEATKAGFEGLADLRRGEADKARKEGEALTDPLMKAISIYRGITAETPPDVADAMRRQADALLGISPDDAARPTIPQSEGKVTSTAGPEVVGILRTTGKSHGRVMLGSGIMRFNDVVKMAKAIRDLRSKGFIVSSNQKSAAQIMRSEMDPRSITELKRHARSGTKISPFAKEVVEFLGL